MIWAPTIPLVREPSQSSELRALTALPSRCQVTLSVRACSWQTRIAFRSNPAVRDKVFGLAVACAFMHGLTMWPARGTDV